jgi:hypothetical protein
MEGRLCGVFVARAWTSCAASRARASAVGGVGRDRGTSPTTLTAVLRECTRSRRARRSSRAVRWRCPSPMRRPLVRCSAPPLPKHLLSVHPASSRMNLVDQETRAPLGGSIRRGLSHDAGARCQGRCRITLTMQGRARCRVSDAGSLSLILSRALSHRSLSRIRSPRAHQRRAGALGGRARRAGGGGAVGGGAHGSRLAARARRPAAPRLRRRTRACTLPPPSPPPPPLPRRPGRGGGAGGGSAPRPPLTLSTRDEKALRADHVRNDDGRGGSWGDKLDLIVTQVGNINAAGSRDEDACRGTLAAAHRHRRSRAAHRDFDDRRCLGISDENVIGRGHEYTDGLDEGICERCRRAGPSICDLLHGRRALLSDLEIVRRRELHARWVTETGRHVGWRTGASSEHLDLAAQLICHLEIAVGS